MSTARLRRETWCGILRREQTETVALISVLKPHFFTRISLPSTRNQRSHSRKCSLNWFKVRSTQNVRFQKHVRICLDFARLHPSWMSTFAATSSSLRITFTANTQRKKVEMTIPINHCVNDNFDDRPEKTWPTNSEWKSRDRAARTACCCMVLYYHWSSFHIYLLFVGFKTRQSAHTRGFPLLDPGKVWKKCLLLSTKNLPDLSEKKDQFLKFGPSLNSTSSGKKNCSKFKWKETPISWSGFH